jgi:diguanylate cyclase (GGDEF)-like protein/putative nucleotidyltransferase with HDIG domain
MEKVKTSQYSLSSYSIPTQILWSILAVGCVGALGYAVYESFEFSWLQFLILGVAVAFAAIANQYHPNFKSTKYQISATELTVIWGVVWLGLPGGTFLSVVAGVASYNIFPKDKKRWLASVFVGGISAAAAALAFYLYLKNFVNFDGTVLAASEISPLWLLSGIGLLATVRFVVYNILFTAFSKLETGISFGRTIQGVLNANLLSYAFGVPAAIIFHYSFVQFGYVVGIIALPLVVAAHLFYRMHFQSLELKTKEIYEASRIHLATVEALATAIDARDQVGVGHVRRTQIYAVGVGEILGLSEPEIHALRTGALLHDIGKLGVPDHILNKPGRLTPAEMEKMKIHSTVGASILEKINFNYPVVPTVKYHHESWDGSGYPEGLAKEEIPLTARILAVADAYDTLRGARPYRAEVNRDDARKFLLKGSNTQFDPKLVDVFLRNLRQFEVEVDAEGLSYELDLASPDLFVGEDGGLSDANQGYVEHIKRANREVFALYELARVFSASLNLQDTLSLFVKKIGELMPFETCVVYLLDKTNETAHAAYAEGHNAEFIKGKRIKMGEGATGYVLSKRQAVYNINPALDFSFYRVDTIQDYTAMASLPLIADERLIGAISLYSCELENYEDEHMRLLETVSRIASDAISKSVYHAETENHALTDPMTDLPNARSLQIQFENEVARAKRNASEFQLLMLDLDGFKAVNDTYGHKIGDLMLKEVAKVMRAQLREYDFLARYAGDEFVAIIPDTTHDGVQELIARLEKAVVGLKLPVGEGKTTGVGVSLGSASYPRHGETIDQVIIAADKAMYNVKATHKQKLLEELPMVEARLAHPGNEVLKLGDDAFIVDLDESHIVSNAVN